MRLSVVIPGYNTRASYWQRCIDSVLKACGDDDEVICVDDGSNVKPQILADYAEKDGRIRVLYLEKNVGQSTARNKALEIARGEWVTFVDSDDRVMPSIYRTCLGIDQLHLIDIVAFGIRGVFVNDGLVLEGRLSDEYIGCLTPAALKKFVAARLFDEPVNKIYRKSFLERHQVVFPDNICPGEDAMFVLSCIMHGARWRTIPDVGYIYYRMDGTTLSRYFPNYIATLHYWKEKWDEYLFGPGKGYDGWWPTMDFSEEWVVRCQWNNIWKRGAPYSLYGRWTYLREHPSIGGTFPLWVFVKKMVFAFLRLHFYFRPIRRWHIKRIRKDAVEMSSFSEDQL